MAHRQAGKFNARAEAQGAQSKGGAIVAAAIIAHIHQIGLAGDVIQQAEQLLAFAAGVSAGHQFDGGLQFIEVGFELAFDGSI